MDFVTISTKHKKDIVEIYPKFVIKKSQDLMIRGGDFYAIWVEDRGLWSTDEEDAIRLIDKEIDIYLEQHEIEGAQVKYLWDADSGMIDKWHKYCQQQLRDSFHTLDEKLIFSNTPTNKKDYASKRLPYPLEEGPIDAYERLMSVLYSPEEREKIEWAIGSIVTGDSKKIQKFMVFYGAAGTGKSTVLNIIQQLFDGYFAVFDAKALGSSNNAFALEAFKSNPLVAIQHDGDLSRIEDNTRLNSLVSHEMMTVNEKFKSTYSNRFKSFLFMGTNKPVRITDAKSGLIRRLIDVSPTGDKLSITEYKAIMKQIEFELGHIACHCRDIYLSDPGKYDNYIPTLMLGASNDFYNFVSDSYFIFKHDDAVTLKAAWEMYKSYCEEAKVSYVMNQRVFKEELKNYFDIFRERHIMPDGSRVRNYYVGFKVDKFIPMESVERVVDDELILFKEQPSAFDEDRAECKAQYANSEGTPRRKWVNVRTRLKDIDTGKLHYVKPPENHIVIDFDLKDKDGNKSLSINQKEASKWPPTYAELSKSGQGIHLHYIYTGDVAQLSRVYSENIEIKTFTGNSSLRRKLTLCNDLPIATIGSGLPLKGAKMVNFEGVKSEKSLRTQIKKNLNKEYHSATKPSIDFIHKILEDAYASDLHYDVTDMRNAVLIFAANSTNNADYCIKLVNKMHFKSEERSEGGTVAETKLIFFDCEVFPNLFLVNWKVEGDRKVMRMINPSSTDIENLLQYRLVGFNCRRYDNHILYGRLIGYSNEELYALSQKIVSGSANGYFGEAYNISYTDVYDFCSKKQSLKKWEIELGLHHKELGLPWDKPVPEDMWVKVAEYCDNDVLATEAVFNARQADFTARKILADLAGMTVNDTTNALTTRIIFGTNREPQEAFNYRFMGDTDCKVETPLGFDEYTAFDEQNRPVFPGYSFDSGKSTYRGEEVGEGGYVYAEPGMYANVALLDVASMHPSSIVAENLFGDGFTERFNDILNARIVIKHGEFDKAKKMLGGALAKYLTDEAIAKDLAGALKIAINSVYGLTAAGFDNPFRDIRNKDNIVAKRGALFMINLKHEVQKRGFIVAHIKTDSIKIPDATPAIIDFVTAYGKMYGYTFEHEDTYERMCLVNDAVYVAKNDKGWSATGAQFQVSYVFKTLFTHEPIEFEDMCETKSVKTALYLDMNEGLTQTPEIENEYEYRVKQGCTVDDDPNGYYIYGSEKFAGMNFQELKKTRDKGHVMHFVGRVGQFCPMVPGAGGGILLRENTNTKTGVVTYAAVTGTKGYRWMESEMVKSLEQENDIDRGYYNRLVDEAVETISKYGDFERFTSDDKFTSENTPPWLE